LIPFGLALLGNIINKEGVVNDVREERRARPSRESDAKVAWRF
jgi:hypothetical protein